MEGREEIQYLAGGDQKYSDWKNLAAIEQIVLATGKIMLHESK